MTLINITFIGGNSERKLSFIRSRDKRPTYAGAARMIAAKLNADDASNGDYPRIKPSDISICRVEAMSYAK
jgi:hypothetical protein